MDLSHYVQTEPTADIINWAKSIKNMPNSNELNYSLLNNSIKYNRLDVVTFLLKNNCNVNNPIETEVTSNTPLHHAVMLGNYSLVEDILKRQAYRLPVNSKGNTPLHLAFIFKHERIVDLLFTALKEISIYENFKNKEGLTHLHIASTRMDATLVENYLKAEADVKDAVSEKSMLWAGYTALHFAAKYKSFAAVNVLLKYKAARDSQDSNGQTPMQLATGNLIDPLMILDVLSRPATDSTKKTSMSHFHTACLKKDPLLVKSYIEKGVNVNLPISPEADFCPSYTPLHFAVEGNYKDTVKLLLDHGADINRANKSGMTPLHLALYKDNTRRIKQVLDIAIIDLLLSRVTDIVREDRVDCNGLSYFHVACTRGNSIDDVKKFLDNGRNVNERVSLGDHEFAGFTPLHFAALYKRRKVVELLIQRGADVNAMDGGKCGTPLHVALEDYTNDTAGFLIDVDAEVTTIRLGDGKTTLHMIVDSLIYIYRHPKYMWMSRHEIRLCMIEQFVAKFVVDVDAKDKDGNTALHLVCLNFKYTSECLLKRLLDCGADVNVENHANRTPFEECSRLDVEESRGDAGNYAMMYHHVQNLKALGLMINPKNEKVCEKLVKRRFEYFGNDVEEFESEKLEQMEKRRLEIERMKSAKIDETMSVYEFVVGDEKNGVAHVDNEVLKKFEDGKEAAMEYPLYGYLIRLKYLKVLRYRGSCSGSSFKRCASSELDGENAMKRLWKL